MIGAIDFASNAPALWIESDGEAISYADLGRRVARVRSLLARQSRPCLAFTFAPNSAGFVAVYLACLAEKIPLGMGEPAEASRGRVVGVYRPNVLFLPTETPNPAAGYKRIEDGDIDGVSIWQLQPPAPYPYAPSPELALLLATSGSTGDAKFVRLTAANLLANAQSIAAYLEIGPTERAIQSLPLHYSYGLSVLNSHLVSGAAIVLTAHSFMRPEFWQTVQARGGTSFAGVPYMYETLARLRLWPTERAPSLRMLTQAGGHLKSDLVRQFLEIAESNGRRFIVMYGQTEATARIAYVPSGRLRDKLGSIGVAIPGGKLWLEPIENDAARQQLYYSGPNVMLGYATEPADLGRGDEMQGVLATGDLADCDSEGFFRVTGRLARFAKLFGKRINLADIEGEGERLIGHRVAALDGGDHLRVFIETSEEAHAERLRSHFVGLLGIPPVAIKARIIELFPLTASGKKDYKALP
jgi:long-chain acyl-CoA synthetase